MKKYKIFYVSQNLLSKKLLKKNLEKFGQQFESNIFLDHDWVVARRSSCLTV
jgi:hypothetical protein